MGSSKKKIPRPRVFISYSTKDSAFVEKLISDFTTANLRFWIDQKEIDAGDSIPKRISKGLKGCDVFLIILSPNSIDSAWVQRELESAIVREIDDKDLKIIPVLISKCRIPPLLRGKRLADFRKSYSSGLIQLLDAIHNRIERKYEIKEANHGLDTFITLKKNLQNSLEGICPKKAEDGTIHLAPDGVPTVTVTIVFRSTGERFNVCLPLDLRCEIAARRIVGELFLKDLPILRRDAYLHRGDFYLAKLHDDSGTKEGSKTSPQFVMSYAPRPGFWSETLREARISDGDEVIVLTAIPYPWAHDAMTASMLNIRAKELISQNPALRVYYYALALIKRRLYRRNLLLF